MRVDTVCTCLHFCLHFDASLYAGVVKWVQDSRKHCYGRAKIQLRELERTPAPFEKSLPPMPIRISVCERMKGCANSVLERRWWHRNKVRADVSADGV